MKPKNNLITQNFYVYIKAQAALIVGSIIDFSITWGLVSLMGNWYVVGNAVGNVSGAIAQYVLSRIWAFKATNQAVSAQLIRYSLMWAGNIALSALGVFLLTNYLHLHYMLSKLNISVILGLTYNYILSRWFVFRKPQL